jgi:hypothetical protein
LTLNEDGQSPESLQQNSGNPSYNDHLPCAGLLLLLSSLSPSLPLSLSSDFTCPDLEVLSLPLFDIDDQPTHPNYLIRMAANVSQSSSINLVTLPSFGVLYLSDGTCEAKDELTLLSSIPRSANGKYLVKYRPAANQHSKR